MDQGQPELAEWRAEQAQTPGRERRVKPGLAEEGRKQALPCESAVPPLTELWLPAVLAEEITQLLRLLMRQITPSSGLS